MEQEFYDFVPFSSREDFLRKAALYQGYLNFVHRNSCEGGRKPREIIKEEKPWVSSEVLKLFPLFLDEEFKKPYPPDFNTTAGHHLPVDRGV
jgi:hypothetical protein